VDRAEIDDALICGRPFRDIARRFRGISKDAAARHKADHLPVTLSAAAAATELASGATLIEKIRALEAQARTIGREAHARGDLRIALGAVRELARIAELQAKLAGDISDGTAVTVAIGTDWESLRSTVLRALANFPDARVAVAAALGAEVEHA
jgi:hypothetical protein